MFDRIDADGDRRLTLDQFVKAAPEIRKWGIEIDDPVKVFHEIDSDGAGMLLFEEFSDWVFIYTISFLF